MLVLQLQLLAVIGGCWRSLAVVGGCWRLPANNKRCLAVLVLMMYNIAINDYVLILCSYGGVVLVIAILFVLGIPLSLIFYVALHNLIFC